MLNWVAVLKRILKLYGVRSTRDLGMALGVPVKLEDEGLGGQAIPWPILEIVTVDKGISWDWLLTGREFSPGAKTEVRSADGKDEVPFMRKPSVTAAKPRAASMPRIETRELRRTLLDGSVKAVSSMSKIPPDEEPAAEPVGESIPQPVEEMPTFDILKPSDYVNREREEAVVRELEAIKASMQAELKRVEKILGERRD